MQQRAGRPLTVMHIQKASDQRKQLHLRMAALTDRILFQFSTAPQDRGGVQAAPVVKIPFFDFADVAD